MRQLLLLLSLLILFAGCGYKPKAKLARSVLGEKVSVGIQILAADPENAVIAKDALLQALITRFKVVTTSRKFSVSHLDVKLNRIKEQSTEYDNNGYVIAKRITVNLSVMRTTKGAKKSYSLTGAYDFNIEPNATVSDTDRFKAIKYASLKAIDSFISQLAVEGK